MRGRESERIIRRGFCSMCVHVVVISRPDARSGNTWPSIQFAENSRTKIRNPSISPVVERGEKKKKKRSFGIRENLLARHSPAGTSRAVDWQLALCARRTREPDGRRRRERGLASISRRPKREIISSGGGKEKLFGNRGQKSSR